MSSRILADLVVTFHLLFILFALFGGLLIIWRRWWIALHLPTVIWVSALEFNSWICPLTPLENRLRQQAGDAGYSGGFIEHYLLPLIYPSGLTPTIQIYLGAAALALNLLIYTGVYHHTRNQPPGS